MNEILLTITQALQLVAIAPCVFVIAFLLCSGIRHGENYIPALYFLSLACSFILPLLALFDTIPHQFWVEGSLYLGISLTVPLSYLLIMQFLLGRVPPPIYWLILALPVVGSSPFIYLMLYANEVCLDLGQCIPTISLYTLYNVFSTALIFLLLIFKISTSAASIAIDETERAHKYWLIIAIVALNLVLAVLDLMVIADMLRADEVLIASTVIRITFIYLVLTSIFVVFYELFEIKLQSGDKGSGSRTQEQDKELVERIKNMLEEEMLYREMGLTRKMLAKRAEVSEHQASRIINAYFRKNFNELINTYRVNEAQARLLVEETPITVIAFEVGFNSIASFNRVFKELTGKSPTEYRVQGVANIHKPHVIPPHGSEEKSS